LRGWFNNGHKTPDSAKAPIEGSSAEGFGAKCQVLSKGEGCAAEGDTAPDKSLGRAATTSASPQSTVETDTSLARHSSSPSVYAGQAHEVQQAQAKLESARSNQIKDGMRLLNERLTYMDLSSVAMEDDGNCQFRALSHQMYGTQDYHSQIRRVICKHMTVHKDEYGLFLTDEENIDSYIWRMRQDREWGDELTLKAAVDAFGLTVHTITSNSQGWHIRHQTDQGVADKASGPEASAWQKAARKTLFISYIVPIHYNSVVPNAPPNGNAPASEATNVSS